MLIQLKKKISFVGFVFNIDPPSCSTNAGRNFALIEPWLSPE